MARAGEQAGVPVYHINPLYSSVGGCTKYGRGNRLDSDKSAASWIARKALFGTPWKHEGARIFVKLNSELPVFLQLSATLMQSMKAREEAQWKDVVRGLGRVRRLWGQTFEAWALSQVEVASKPGKGGPQPVIAPAARRHGFQPGASRIPCASESSGVRSAGVG